MMGIPNVACAMKGKKRKSGSPRMGRILADQRRGSTFAFLSAKQARQTSVSAEASVGNFDGGRAGQSNRVPNSPATRRPVLRTC